ncbi:MAG: TlpA family protein disulfide reductase, partial [Bacteroidia bacterium]|nr:TlpA family protein disulfide reductase [Bacteroidia bacterium]
MSCKFKVQSSKLAGIFFLILCALPFVTTAQKMIHQGSWRGVLQLNDSTELPFNFTCEFSAVTQTLTIRNGKERIVVDEIVYDGDSVFIHFPFFDSEIRAFCAGHNIDGRFVNNMRIDKKIIPFKAKMFQDFRFTQKKEKPAINITGKWKITFKEDDPIDAFGIGEFVQTGNYVEGTVLTPAGDHRYLEGTVQGNKIFLSAFDGSHAFLYKATINADSTLSGDFFSGAHWHQTWTAVRDEKVELPNPDTLTFLNPGFKQFSFSFPDTTNTKISFPDKKFQNKVVIIQIMGTWCPNCLDESQFLTEYYSKNKLRGVEIIALDYERKDDFGKAKNNIARLQKRLNITYPILFAGTTSS